MKRINFIGVALVALLSTGISQSHAANEWSASYQPITSFTVYNGEIIVIKLGQPAITSPNPASCSATQQYGYYVVDPALTSASFKMNDSSLLTAVTSGKSVKSYVADNGCSDDKAQIGAVDVQPQENTPHKVQIKNRGICSMKYLLTSIVMLTVTPVALAGG